MSKLPANSPLRETNLFAPVKNFLEELGYAVQGEIGDCDVVALRREEILAVELKLRLNIDLLIQASRRLSITPNVYIALPIEVAGSRRRKWADCKRILRLLGFGVLLVNLSPSSQPVQVLFDPAPWRPRPDARKRSRLLEEFKQRRDRLTQGGVAGKRIMTVYREQAVLILLILQRLENASPAQIRRLCSVEKTARILRDNHYGWFEKISRGLYTSSAYGKEVVADYAHYEQIFEDVLAATQP